MKLVRPLIFLSFFLCTFAVAREDRKFVFQKKVEAILSEVDPAAQVGIEVVSLYSGEVLYEKNAHIRQVPASSAKVFTVAAAFDQLGPGFAYETQVFSRGKVYEGRLQGNLYLKGAGDPSLKSRDFKELAHRIRESGITVIDGDLVVDTTLFDDIYFGPGWMWDDMPTSWCPPLGALNVDHSRFSLWVEPTESALHPVIRLGLTSEKVKIDNHAKVGKNDTLRVYRALHLEGQPIEVEGTINKESSDKKFKIPVQNPLSHATYLFLQGLKEQGITLTGTVYVQKTPSSAKLVAVHRSQPLAHLAQKMLKKSDNFYADALFKRLGQGTWQGGSQAVRSFLSQRLNFEKDEIILLDGSGLSRYNLVAPHHLISLLQWVHCTSPFSEEFKSALAVSGVDGTLKKRFDSGRFRSKIRAKTGTMSGVSSIAGYLTTKNKEPLVFAIVVTGFTCPCKTLKSQLEDALLNEMLLLAKPAQ